MDYYPGRYIVGIGYEHRPFSCVDSTTDDNDFEYELGDHVQSFTECVYTSIGSRLVIG